MKIIYGYRREIVFMFTIFTWGRKYDYWLFRSSKPKTHFLLFFVIRPTLNYRNSSSADLVSNSTDSSHHSAFETPPLSIWFYTPKIRLSSIFFECFHSEIRSQEIIRLVFSLFAVFLSHWVWIAKSLTLIFELFILRISALQLESRYLP